MTKQEELNLAYSNYLTKFQEWYKSINLASSEDKRESIKKINEDFSKKELIKLRKSTNNEEEELPSTFSNFSERFSWPFFISLEWQLGLTSEQEYKPVDILVYGQETYGYPSEHWVKKATPCEQYYKQDEPNKSIWKIVNLNKICCKLFTFPYLPDMGKADWKEPPNENKPDKVVQKHYTSPFWKFMKGIKGTKKDKKIIWSNMIRFDLDSKRMNCETKWKKGIQPTVDNFLQFFWAPGKIDETKKESIERYNNTEKEFIKQHAELIKHEIDILEPKMVIFFTPLEKPNTKGYNDNSNNEEEIKKDVSDEKNIPKEIYQKIINTVFSDKENCEVNYKHDTIGYSYGFRCGIADSSARPILQRLNSSKSDISKEKDKPQFYQTYHPAYLSRLMSLEAVIEHLKSISSQIP